jgi:hypothetical protein
MCTNYKRVSEMLSDEEHQPVIRAGEQAVDRPAQHERLADPQRVLNYEEYAADEQGCAMPAEEHGNRERCGGVFGRGGHRRRFICLIQPNRTGRARPARQRPQRHSLCRLRIATSGELLGRCIHGWRRLAGEKKWKPPAPPETGGSKRHA